MLGRELTYQMPFERLLKLSRMASRKAYAMSWRLLWLLFAVYVAALWIVIQYSQPIDAWLAEYGLPDLSPIAAIIVGFVLAFWVLRRYGLKQMKQRADYDSAVRFSQEADGLRFATPEVEYFVKWRGLSQMMLVESDGILFSHGNLFFLVPNEAFNDQSERDALVRDVFPRLGDVARGRSTAFIPPALMPPGSTTGN